MQKNVLHRKKTTILSSLCLITCSTTLIQHYLDLYQEYIIAVDALNAFAFTSKNQQVTIIFLHIVLMSFCISLKCQLSVSLLASGSRMLSPLSQNMQDELKHYPLRDTVSAQKGTCFVQQPFSYLLLSCSMSIFFLPLVWLTSQLGPDVVKHGSEKHTKLKRQFSFLFALLCSVFFQFVFCLFGWFLFCLSQGWSKEVYLINPFQTGRLWRFITRQNY